MSALITAQNIDLVVKKNCEIKDEILTTDIDYNMDEDALEKIRAKAYQPRGYFVDLEKNLMQLDQVAESTGVSKYFNFKRKKNGEFYESNILTSEEFGVLENFVSNKISSMYKNTNDGIISVSPRKEGLSPSSQITSCTYCDYKAICKFDEKLRGNKLREPKRLVDEIKETKDIKKPTTQDKISFMKEKLEDTEKRGGGNLE